MPVSPDASPFAGTAQYYDRFRAPYAPAAFGFIVEAFGLGRGARALDLGCGPGAIAIPLSHTVAEVAAADPDADMIAERERLAGSKGRRNIRWLRQAASTRELEPVANQVVAKFLGPRIRHPKSNPREPEHEPALLRSEYFPEFTARELPGAVTRDINSIIGCIYSISNSARPLFGDTASSFEAELSKALLSLDPAGVFNERIETEVVIAQESPVGSLGVPTPTPSATPAAANRRCG